MSRGLDYSRASTARVYNYYLGGKSWSRVDKEAAEKVIRSAPDAPEVARENLRFAGRAASWAVSAYGIRQVIDIGVGIVDDVPIPAVEECVLEAAPDAVVVAFDHDEVVLAHGRALRPGYGGVLRGDVTDLARAIGYDQRIDIEVVIVLGVRNCRFQRLLHGAGDALAREFQVVQRSRHLLAANHGGNQVQLLRADADRTQDGTRLVVSKPARSFGLAHRYFLFAFLSAPCP